MTVNKPVLFDMLNAEDRTAFEQCVREQTGAVRVDEYEGMLKELCAIQNPAVRGTAVEPVWEHYAREHCAGRTFAQRGVWAFFSWRRLFVHYLAPALHHELRTARNRNVITKEEQELFAQCAVGIAGLSVGSHAALTIAMMGGCHTMKLADPDVLSGSNLNRVRAGYEMVGQKKVDAVADQIYKMNPYADVHLFAEGIHQNNFHEFVERGKRIAVFVEEMDNMELKIKTRLWAREAKLPVVMVTDNGDGVIVDVERYDTYSALPLFGREVRLPSGPLDQLLPQERMRLISELVDFSLVEQRAIDSFNEVGRTLYSWPQLGTAATLAGVAVAYVVRKIALGEPCPSKRSVISLRDLL